jgi:heat shock protein HslJ
MKNLVFLVLVVSIISCKKAGEVTPKSATLGLTDHSELYSKWILKSTENTSKINYEVVLELKNERNEKGNFILNGKSSVNFYSAEFVLNDKKITISDMLSTQIAGDSKATNFENDYFKRLSEVETFRLDHGLLTLIGKNQKMTYKVSN